MAHRLAAVALWVGLAALALSPSAARGFGTIDGIGQDREHERITRAALECFGKPRIPDAPGRCFEPLSIDELAGKKGTFGAVGAPDVDSFFEDVPHCTAGDHLTRRQNGGDRYPRSRGDADEALVECWDELRLQFELAAQLADDLVDRTTPVILPDAVDITDCGYVDEARAEAGYDAFVDSHGTLTSFVALVVRTILDLAENAETIEPDESAKCQVLLHVGRMLHGMQDFYSHSNWTDRHLERDRRGRRVPIGRHNPPGLDQRARAPFLDMLSGGPAIAKGLITACYTFVLAGDCRRRVDHDADLAKDTGRIRVVPGPRPGAENSISATKPTTPRGEVLGNFNRAVVGAKRETMGAWKDFGATLLNDYGIVRGTLMICAITHDDPVRDCTPGDGSGGSATVTELALSHYHPPDSEFSLFCGTARGTPGANGVFTGSGPNGYGFEAPFTFPESGIRSFNSIITSPGVYTATVTNGTTTLTRTYTVPPPPPEGEMVGPVDCSMFPMPG